MAFTLIVNTALRSTNTTSVTTSAIDTTGANLLVLALSNYQPGPVATISDSKTNTWTPLTTYEQAGQNRIKLYYVAGPTVGSGHTFTATNATAQYPSVAVAAFAGAHASPFRAESGQAGDTGDASQRHPGSVASGGATDLFVSGCSELGAGITLSVDSGFTVTDFLPGDSNSIGIALAYKIQTSASAENPGWTPSAVMYTMCNLAAFTAAAVTGSAALTGTMVGGITESDVV
jgi:hypothetical protein